MANERQITLDSIKGQVAPATPLKIVNGLGNHCIKIT